MKTLILQKFIEFAVKEVIEVLVKKPRSKKNYYPILIAIVVAFLLAFGMYNLIQWLSFGLEFNFENEIISNYQIYN